MIDLKNMDCIQFLSSVSDASVQLVLIDPPYEVSRETNFSNGQPSGKDTDRFRVSMEFGSWDYDFMGMEKVIKECYRVLSTSGTIICFYDLWKIDRLREYLCNAGFCQLRFIEWIKTNPVPLNSKINYLTNAREIAITAVKGNTPVFKSEYDNGVYSYPICHEKGRFHPTQKPVELIRDLILKHSNNGDIILDCFSGSGTTAVASILTNRNFIGCELDKNYYNKSIERINGYIEKYSNRLW